MTDPASANRDRLQFGFSGDMDGIDVAAAEALPIDSLWVGGHVALDGPGRFPKHSGACSGSARGRIASP